MLKRISLYICLLLLLPGVAEIYAQRIQPFGSPANTSQSTDSATVAVISTRLGTIEIQLYTHDAPKTAANFIGLAKQGYYNGVIFHRIAKGFVIQGGDSTGTGASGRSIYGHKFEDELDPGTRSYQEGYQRGVVAMANSGPNSNTSQFFIMLGEAPYLPKAYTIFGKVIRGMEVVDSIAAAEIVPQMGPEDGRPVEPVAMQRVTIEKRPQEIKSIFDLK